MLSMSNAEILIHAFMTSRLDYCNAFVKDFTPFTLFNLALWFKLYFSFRES